MGLTIGTQLGSHEITALLGKGGMGEVYRARDLKLKREVAIKLLPEEFARDSDRVSRFQREAEVLASLNHPNIAGIHDLAEANGSRYLVLELVEGETLADRIARGPMPVEEALPIAIQICEALEAAHERGIIHRDLKPANVKITPDGKVKVLDFGLARAMGDTTANPAMSNSPTLLSGSIGGAVLMGTAAYMSPEQAVGRAVDRRADIWAFGAVLWEMLTGRALFNGETVSHILADVIRAEIDFKSLPQTTPAALNELLKRCLDRDVKNRLRDIGEARVALSRLQTAPLEAVESIEPRRLLRAIWFWAVAASVVAALAITTAVALWAPWRTQPTPAELVRFEIPKPDTIMNFGMLTLSPDGKRLAFDARPAGGGQSMLWVRSLDTLEMRSLPGTEGARNDPAFWSFDSRSLVYVTGAKLMRVDVAGGSPQVLCDLSATRLSMGITTTPLTGGFWTRDGTIVFSSAGGLQRVSQAGGIASRLTDDGTFPQLLPDGRHFVYHRGDGMYAGTLDSPPATWGSKRLLQTGSLAARYAPSSNPAMGYLLFVRGSTLMAQSLDNARLETVGDPVRITEPVGGAGPPSFPGNFSISATGVLAHKRSGSAGSEESRQYQLMWHDRKGKEMGVAGAPGPYIDVALSPDATQVAFKEAASFPGGYANAKTNLWLLEFARGASMQFTFVSGAADRFPVWSPDGSRIVFSSHREAATDLYMKAANGAGGEQLVLKSGEDKTPTDWSRDGRFLLYTSPGVGPYNSRIWSLAMSGVSGSPSQPVAYNTETSAQQGRFSPDARFVAYVGPDGLYVQPFPDAAGGKWRITAGNASQPRWRRDGKELFYLTRAEAGMTRVMSVEILTGSGPAAPFKFGVPKELFAIPLRNSVTWDVSADGQRFLITSPVRPTSATPVPLEPIIVEMNWEAGLKK
jgi:Tol biopolymer transport system component